MEHACATALCLGRSHLPLGFYATCATAVHFYLVHTHTPRVPPLAGLTPGWTPIRIRALCCGRGLRLPPAAFAGWFLPACHTTCRRLPFLLRACHCLLPLGWFLYLHCAVLTAYAVSTTLRAGLPFSHAACTFCIPNAFTCRTHACCACLLYARCSHAHWFNTSSVTGSFSAPRFLIFSATLRTACVSALRAGCAPCLDSCLFCLGFHYFPGFFATAACLSYISLVLSPLPWSLSFYMVLLSVTCLLLLVCTLHYTSAFYFLRIYHASSVGCACLRFDHAPLPAFLPPLLHF